MYKLTKQVDGIFVVRKYNTGKSRLSIDCRAELPCSLDVVNYLEGEGVELEHISAALIAINGRKFEQAYFNRKKELFYLN